MRKNIFYMVLACLLLASCNLPQKSTITPTQNLIETIVVGTLTARPSTTPTLEPTVTPPPPTPQLLTPTALNAPTYTATPLTGDPKTALGNPTGKDTLDTGKGFGVGPEGYEDDNVKITVTNGALVLSSNSTVGWRSWRLRPPALSNFYLEGTFKAASCNGNDQYGLVIRAPNYDTGFGYYFSLTCDGKYALSRWDDKGTATMINGENVPEILGGPDQTNRLGILAKNNSLKLFINGKELQEINDASFQNGYFGVFIAGYSGAGFSVSLDEIAYWNQ